MGRYDTASKLDQGAAPAKADEHCFAGGERLGLLLKDDLGFSVNQTKLMKNWHQ